MVVALNVPASQIPPAGSAGSAGTAVLADDQLMASIRDHDARAEEALAVLYDRYSASVHALALRVVRDRRTAEEVLQETFWRVWRNAGQYEAGRVRFATWLLRVASNLAISELRQTGRRPVVAEQPAQPADRDGAPSGVWGAAGEPADPAADVPELAWQAERRRLVAAALATLPAEQRHAVELAYFGGLTHREIAAAQGAPASTVKTRLALGLRKLGAVLAPQELGYAAAGSPELRETYATGLSSKAA